MQRDVVPLRRGRRPGSNIETTAVIGLVVATTKLDAVKAIRDLGGLLKDRPWEFKYTLKLVPIQTVVDANLEAIQAAALLLKGSGKRKFRITVEKRHTDLKSKTIIDTVAKKIERTVNLEHPDKILMIEIIGERAGLALITPDDVLSVEREKRNPDIHFLTASKADLSIAKRSIPLMGSSPTLRIAFNSLSRIPERANVPRLVIDHSSSRLSTHFRCKISVKESDTSLMVRSVLQLKRQFFCLGVTPTRFSASKFVCS